MPLLYFITTVTSQVHSARHHQRAGYSALPSVYIVHYCYKLQFLTIMYVAIYLPEQPCFVGTFSKRHITVNFSILSVDL